MNAAISQPTAVRILLTGASGFVGSRAAAALARQGPVTRLARRAAADVDWVCDLAREVPAAAQLETFDCVVHLAAHAHTAEPRDTAGREAVTAVNHRAVEQLARNAAAAGVRRFVFLSSSKVLGDVSRAPLAEDAPPAPAGVYARAKADAERALADLADRADMAVCIVRAPLVYGPGVRANFLALMRLADSPLPLPLGGANAPRSFVSVGNLAAFLALVSRQGDGVYHVTDGHSVAVGESLRDMRQMLGRPARLFSVPTALLRTLARASGRGDAYARLFEAMELADGRARAELGWQPPEGRRDALRETMHWYCTNRT
jgi:UDP-glucose 4-epimerase